MLNYINDVMIVCIEKDKDFKFYKEKVNNRKILFNIKDILTSIRIIIN